MASPDPAPAQPSRLKPIGDILTPIAILALCGVLFCSRTPAPAPAPDTKPDVPITPKPIPKPPGPPAPQPKPDDVDVDVDVPASPLAKAAAAYVKSLPNTFKSMASQVRSGQIADKAAAVESMKAQRQAFAAALDQAFASACDDQGTITKPKALAAQLDAVAAALGAK